MKNTRKTTKQTKVELFNAIISSVEKRNALLRTKITEKIEIKKKINPVINKKINAQMQNDNLKLFADACEYKSTSIQENSLLQELFPEEYATLRKERHEKFCFHLHSNNFFKSTTTDEQEKKNSTTIKEDFKLPKNILSPSDLLNFTNQKKPVSLDSSLIIAYLKNKFPEADIKQYSRAIFFTPSNDTQRSKIIIFLKTQEFQYNLHGKNLTIDWKDYQEKFSTLIWLDSIKSLLQKKLNLNQNDLVIEGTSKILIKLFSFNNPSKTPKDVLGFNYTYKRNLSEDNYVFDLEISFNEDRNIKRANDLLLQEFSDLPQMSLKK